MTDGDIKDILIKFANGTKLGGAVETVYERFKVQNYLHRSMMSSYFKKSVT